MKLPWTSRAAFDVMVAQNERLIDELARIARHSQGMREVGPGNAPPQKRIEIPPEVQELINAVDNPEFRRMAKARAIQLYRETKDWDVVQRRMERETGDV